MNFAAEKSGGLQKRGYRPTNRKMRIRTGELKFNGRLAFRNQTGLAHFGLDLLPVPISFFAQRVIFHRLDALSRHFFCVEGLKTVFFSTALEFIHGDFTRRADHLEGCTS